MTALTVDFKTAFEALPGNFLIFKPDAPHYSILAISDELLQNTGRERIKVLGKSVFEVYPENPDAVTATGPSILSTSIQNAIAYKRYDQMPTVRYDVISASGDFEERYWSASNKPVLNAEGNVAYIIHSTVDVTEQELAKKKRDEHEQKMRSLIESAPFPIAVYEGKEMCIQLANQAMIEAWGKGKEVVGSLLSELLPELGPIVDQQLDAVYTTGVPYHAMNEFMEIVVDGKPQPFYYNYSFTPLFDGNGQVYGVMNTAADVTSLMLAKQKLEESESRFRHLIEQAPVAIGLTRGKEHFIENMNAPMLRIIGRSREEAVGKNLTVAMPEIKEEFILKILNPVLETGERYSGNEVPFHFKTGDKLEQYYLNLSYTPLLEEGEITGIIHVAVDVTEQVEVRKKIEEGQEELKRFKFMADQARDPFILMRADGSFAYLNNKAQKAWGYTEDELQHLRVPDTDPLYHAEAFSQLFAKAQIESIPQFETLHKNKQGQIYPVEINVVGLLLGGNPYLFAIARDITQRRKAEEEIKASNVELRMVNNDLDNFIYTASHDLKAPISNIEALLVALLRTLPPECLNAERTIRITDKMHESVDRFKKTIANLTEVVKLQKENSTESVLVNISEVVKEVRLDLEQVIQSSGVHLEIDLADCSTIKFSEKNLRSVMYNLLSNAIKYRSPERMPKVQVSCSSTSDYIVLSVKDNGLGIDSSKINQLFTMFKRFHSHVEGTGIGLYMVKKMVENAGGRIEVESQLGEGTTFHIFLKH